jgi:hypothetical protein
MAFAMGTTVVPASVIISEFMAANSSGLVDEDGATSDWIELHNTAATSVDLTGWWLTDDADNLAQWQMPATNLPPGGFLVVFASGKNRAVPGAPLHTSFSLGAAGEYLGLVQPDGTTVAFEYAPAFPQQYDNISYGVTVTNAEVREFFAVATPGAVNATSYFAQVADTKFTPDRGFYTTNIAVTITTATPEAVIRYTLNGTPPTESTGFVYTNPIAVTNTTVLRAAAFKPGILPSDVDTHTYIFLRDVVGQSLDGDPPPGWPASWGENHVDYGMDTWIVATSPWREAITNALKSIPTISLVLPLPSLFDPATGIYANSEQDGPLWERATSVELLQPDGNETKQFQIDGGLRIRGGFSRDPGNPKHSFRVLLRSEYGQSRLDYPFFGPSAAASFKKFDIRSHQDDSWHFVDDPSRGEILRDAFSRDTMLAMGGVATHGNYHHLYLNGQYWGLFTTEERPEANFGASYFGGDENNYDTIKVDADGYVIDATDGDFGAWERLWEAANDGFDTAAAYQKVQGRNPDGSPNSALENLLDVPALINYMLVIIYTGNIDAPISDFQANEKPNNWFGVRERSGLFGGFRFLLHDSENSLYDLNDDRTGPFPAGDPDAGSSFNQSNPQYLWQKLSANPEFRMLVADHVQRHFFNDGALTVAAVTNRYQARRAEIDQAVIAESARWGDAMRFPPYTYNDWRRASDGLLTNYFPYRTAIVLNQLRAKGLFPSLAAPSLSQRGGSFEPGFELTLAHTNTAGAIYFTLDGSDPRLSGGDIAPGAQSYSDPIVLNAATQVRARVKNGATWSAIAEATFYPTQDFTPLAITELMYNPPPFGAYPGNDLEFLELQNTGTNTLDLSGLSFTGITFNFTNGTLLGPGEFLVLARNVTAFAAKYPGVTVRGTYTGQLDNAGERLRILGPFTNTIRDLTYDDRAPWPLAPDVADFSLVLRSSEGNLNDGLNWRASTNPGGSPGAADPAPTVPPILISEILAHTDPPQSDSIELFNPTAQPVNIGGWFLTDSATAPMKYRIPTNTFINPGAYVVFNETQFNPTPGVGNSFSLSSFGEEIYLLSGGSTTNLTGYSYGLVFGATANGQSLGRYVNSVGDEHFPPQRQTSLGLSNVGPQIGPVVIAEIQYHPAAGAPEFIELQNIANTNVLLYHPVYPTNTWKLTGLGYSLPGNVILPAGARLILTAMDPAAFRMLYSVPAEVQIFGPYPGVLQDSGEWLELQRPDNPELTFTPYLTVDAVRYNDKFPWPVSADGDGPSLQRGVLAAYGNDPTNWFAAGITPGLPNAINQMPEVAVLTPAADTIYNPLAPVSISAGASDPDGTITKVEFLANGAPLTTVSNAPYSFVWTNPAPGSYSLVAVAHDNESGVATSAAVPIHVLAPQTVTLVSTGAVWRYLNDGSDQGASWQQTGFNDGDWLAGPAPLGWGNGAEATVLAGSPITTYFRRVFVVADPTNYVGLTVALRRDDGAAVYLNGVELLRSNLPAASLNYLTPASAEVDGAGENIFYLTSVPTAQLLAGTNVLSVELHQVGANDEDASFDGKLTAAYLIPDSDGDGLPDIWELSNGLNPSVNDAQLDADGDGLTNAQEYHAGTDPQNAASTLRLTVVAPGAGGCCPVLEWDAMAGRSYTVLSSSTLAAPQWEKLMDFPAATTNRVLSLPLPAPGAAQEYYRVVTPAQP